MSKLWKRSGAKVNPVVEKYTAGTDYLFDRVLMPFDIAASAVHAKGLEKASILSKNELTKILEALDELQQACAAGSVTVTPEDEDCHTVIENYLVKKLGDTGKKIHTARSRNDQVATAVRLYMKEHLGKLRAQALVLAEQFLDFAEKHASVPMPGYSHTQQAMLTTVGHFAAAHAEALLDDADFLKVVETQIDKSPLGGAAGFGTSIPIDRAFTAKSMGFGGIQINSLYVQNSRGKMESLYLEALTQLMLSLGKFASDMLLFTSREFDFFDVDESLTTGSSIMPHKRNLDALEIVRGNVSVLIGNQLMAKELGKNLTSGYHRDGQLIKKPLFESTQIVFDSLEIMRIVLQGLYPKPQSMRAKMDGGMFTADAANELVKKGMPFRDAYQKAASMTTDDVDLAKNIASKKSLGAPGNLGLDVLRKRLK